MDFSMFLEPPGSNLREFADTLPENTFGKTIRFIEEDADETIFKEIDVAIIGVKEDRAAVNNAGCANGADKVRKKLYSLFGAFDTSKVADFGNISMGDEIKDTYFAVTTIVSELLKKKILTIIIGGSEDVTYAVYRAYESLEQTVNIACVDSAFDIGDMEQDLTSKSFLSRIILHRPNYLFNYSNIGYQTYFVDQKNVDLIDKLYFDAFRLGWVRANMEEVEPVVRDADMLSFDLSAVRYSDAPGNRNSSPNGFYGEEACQIARYAGLSDKLSSIGFYELNPMADKDEQTAFLIAEMIWYFIEGFYNRKKDYPIGDKKGYLKYIVSLEDGKYELNFYKSDKSGRWWMEVPYPPKKKSKYERHFMVPCSYNDYKTACNNEMPDRWWQAFQKLS